MRMTSFHHFMADVIGLYLSSRKLMREATSSIMRGEYFQYKVLKTAT